MKNLSIDCFNGDCCMTVTIGLRGSWAFTMSWTEWHIYQVTVRLFLPSCCVNSPSECLWGNSSWFRSPEKTLHSIRIAGFIINSFIVKVMVHSKMRNEIKRKAIYSPSVCFKPVWVSLCWSQKMMYWKMLQMIIVDFHSIVFLLSISMATNFQYFS